ncbi:MAG TPA: hypothetical protein ENF16_06440 [Bacteroidetes bacterium]|nr:hypothetical protein [Bacteroidota bacterium]
MRRNRVEFYSGGSRDDKPTALIINGRRLQIRRIIREGRIGSPIPEGGYHRIFIVEDEDGNTWNIREAPYEACGWEIRPFPE